MATSWAFPYLKDFPFNPSETFKGDGQNTHQVNIDVIASFVDPIKSTLQDKAIHNIIPNWNKTLEDLMGSTEVWFVTEMEAYSYIPVLNRFSYTIENLQIPLYISRPSEPQPVSPSKDASGEKWKKWEEELKEWRKRMEKEEDEIRKKPEIIDPLGCYVPKTGTILIWVDKISTYGDKSQLIFQKVLLHEFIHAVLDLQQRDKKGNMIDSRYVISHNDWHYWTEETLDNALVLRAYKGTKEYQFVEDFIKTQPSDYALAADTNKITDQFLKDNLKVLISNKINH